MSYFYEYSFLGEEELMEIVMAELSIIDFDSFDILEGGLKAYILGDKDDEMYVREVCYKYGLSYNKEEIKKINWNQEWENNFHPIEIEGKCTVRASFHQKSNNPIDLIITPKMSFGTGHHSTTYMMLEFILEVEIEGKDVCDIGCGTGILGILSSKRNAKNIDMIDIDEWSVINSKENIELNKAKNIKVYQGDVYIILENRYDIIFANINKNVLMKNMKDYSNMLKKGGIIYLSGFYYEDKLDILNVCKEEGLFYLEEKEKKNWLAIKLEKK